MFLYIESPIYIHAYREGIMWNNYDSAISLFVRHHCAVYMWCRYTSICYTSMFLKSRRSRVDDVNSCLSIGGYGVRINEVKSCNCKASV